MSFQLKRRLLQVMVVAILAGLADVANSPALQAASATGTCQPKPLGCMPEAECEEKSGESCGPTYGGPPPVVCEEDNTYDCASYPGCSQTKLLCTPE